MVGRVRNWLSKDWQLNEARIRQIITAMQTLRPREVFPWAVRYRLKNCLDSKGRKMMNGVLKSIAPWPRPMWIKISLSHRNSSSSNKRPLTLDINSQAHKGYRHQGMTFFNYYAGQLKNNVHRYQKLYVSVPYC